MELKHVDNGRAFDFGRTSEYYAKFRDIYTESFYKTLLNLNVGKSGQSILDLGTGSGVIPRNMYKNGAKWTGADISAAQIEQARKLTSDGKMDIDYVVCPADNIPFDDNSFDIVTACQCFWYFPKETTIPEIKRVLKPGGKLVVLSMIGLPRESAILAKSEELVLKYNPEWNGCGFKRATLQVHDGLGDDFFATTLHTYVEDVEFTREAWCGRMRACRGVGASLPPDLVAEYDKDHYNMLCEIADETFKIPHQFMFNVYDVIGK